MRRPFDADDTTRALPALALGLVLSTLATCGGLFGPDTVSDVGTVEFVEVEGGCWTIQTESERYEPTNLPEEFEQDGLPVRFEGELREDMASVCQIGPLLELDTIERRSE